MIQYTITYACTHQEHCEHVGPWPPCDIVCPKPCPACWWDAVLAARPLPPRRPQDRWYAANAPPIRRARTVRRRHSAPAVRHDIPDPATPEP